MWDPEVTGVASGLISIGVGVWFVIVIGFLWPFRVLVAFARRSAERVNS